ncbi:hypothetical protein SOI69_04215 [Acinetobacter pittii]|uniref:hypothetical protein n=1 Tax=Acinetobacter pittii TaxID=48296 RepID=UPI0007EB3F50|nr:hypothetical protein [Acinetobacter pittii]OBA11938.1 hypothetical protein A9988_08955 [Acinetobacter calcoaceticus]WPP56478.1 hypothetical protein SOI69_04215 [Acinetobacter pittii]
MRKIIIKSLQEYKNILNKLEADKNNVDLLLKLQELLLSWHKWLESYSYHRKIRLNKLSKLKKDRSNDKETSLLYKKSINICSKEIENLKQLKLWARHLGNSIPHLYYDKGDLRAYSYSITSTNLKELSGDLFGKNGQELELEIFRNGISIGAKALLTDLTSIIRHGDIMFMDEEKPPLLMEVKSSNAMAKTAQKQLQHMKNISTFLSSHGDPELIRGDGISKRIAATVEERSNKEQINDALEKTWKNGANFTEIEEGLYIFSYMSNCKEMNSDLSKLDLLQDPIKFSLNEIKNTEDQSLLFPYALSISNTEIFAHFLIDELIIYFIIDWSVFKKIVNDNNINCEILTSTGILSISTEGIPEGISYTMMKAFSEFSSLNWAFEQLVNMYLESINSLRT